MAGYHGAVQPHLRGRTAIADVAEADADATYGAEEAALINEIKLQLNALLAELRLSGIVKS